MTRWFLGTVVALLLFSMVAPQLSANAAPLAATPGHVGNRAAPVPLGLHIPALPAGGPLALNAPGTGAFSTDPATYNNTGVNTTLTVPGSSSFSVSSSQVVLLGIGDPVNSTNFTAAGAAITSASVVGEVVAAVAYLPNGTIIEPCSSCLSTLLQYSSWSATPYTFSITHTSGTWWTFKVGTTPITDGSGSGWKNGTYNLGMSVAPGKAMVGGVPYGPSFVGLGWGNGTSPPSIPTTNVRWSIGVEQNGGSSTSYVPLSANEMPQFNSSLGTVGIQGHDQIPSYPVEQLEIGSSVPTTADYAPLWGNYNVRLITSVTVSPQSASLSYSGYQVFNAQAFDQTGAALAQASYTWAYSPASLGTLNATTGPSVNLTAGSTTVTGMLWANATFNGTTRGSSSFVSVSPTGGPSILSYGVSPTPILVNTPTNFTASVAPWPWPTTLTYTGLPGGCASANSSTLPCTPNVPGTFNVTVFVNDTTGHTTNSVTPLTVYPDLSLGGFTATPSTISNGTNTTFAVSTHGGLPALTYVYTGLPNGCTTSNVPSLGCTPKMAGTYSVRVFVNDSTGSSVNATATLTVNAKLVLVSFTISPTPINVSATTYLNVTISGGTSPFSYAYSNLPSGCSTSDSAKITCVPTIPGNFLIKVNVTDSGGAVVPGAAPLAVTSPLPVVTSFTATPSTIDLGNSTTIKAIAAGGSAPYTYLYAGLPAGCASTLATFACTPTVYGNFTLSLTLTDSAGNVATGSTHLTVKSGGVVTAPTISSFAASPATIATGATTYINVTATGGAAPYSYTYTGLPGGCASSSTATLTCTPTASGTFTIRVYVNDSSGRGANSVTSLVVNGGGSTSGSGIPLLWIAIIAAIAVVVVVATVLLMRRKKAPAQHNPYGNYPPPQQQGPPPPGPR